MRVASPVVRAACPYGVRSPSTDELAITKHGTVTDLASWMEAHSVGFLSTDGLRASVGIAADGDFPWCDGCFTTAWPIPPEVPSDQLPLFGGDG